MNTTTLPAPASARVQPADVRRNARRLRRRLVARLGWALVAWDRRRDARSTRDAVQLARRNAEALDRARRDALNDAYTLTRSWA